MDDLNTATIESTKIIFFPSHIDNKGELVVMESNNLVPFSLSRVFTVSSSKGSVRGKHAHKRCTQLMVCISGSIEIICDDGKNQIQYLLNKKNMGLLVPPGIWAHQNYKSDISLLMVLCDLPYDSSDYIDNMVDFHKFKNIK
jgi:dTDP-4-dehydrorhamnose 3,5-epimerase-like enzyme